MTYVSHVNFCERVYINNSLYNYLLAKGYHYLIIVTPPINNDCFAVDPAFDWNTWGFDNKWWILYKVKK